MSFCVKDSKKSAVLNNLAFTFNEHWKRKNTWLIELMFKTEIKSNLEV